MLDFSLAHLIVCFDCDALHRVVSTVAKARWSRVAVIARWTHGNSKTKRDGRVFSCCRPTTITGRRPRPTMTAVILGFSTWKPWARLICPTRPSTKCSPRGLLSTTTQTLLRSSRHRRQTAIKRTSGRTFEVNSCLYYSLYWWFRLN